ncbi:hypothetical protein FACS1894140_4000 [Spirochaetia bacterium]|nr:hypothetical protein FACS1894140_4000 [Spirochaetia bacterium]
MDIIFLIAGGVLLVVLLIWIMSRRIVVPSDVVHIVQHRKKTISYGTGKVGGNVYYNWPSWLLGIGITSRKLSVSNFDLDLSEYEAYDKDRVPFNVDVKAFFRIEDTDKAATRVTDMKELMDHLTGIVQGSVRSILANSPLIEIMGERSKYGEIFTNDTKDELANWGVIPVKNIELMDIKDAKGSLVISNIMAKRKSEIEKESREVVALNNQKAQEAEIEANKEVEVAKAEAARLSGEATARSSQAVGIAQQQSEQAIQEEMKITATKQMAVQEVNTVRAAEITKQSVIVTAEQEKEVVRLTAEAVQSKIKVETDAAKYQREITAEAAKVAISKEADAEKYKLEATAEGKLAQMKAEAEGKEAIGLAEGEAEKARQLASVVAQTTLAKEVGENEGYQQYLITIEQVKANRDIGIEQAKNLGHADIKIIANSGDAVSGLKSVSEVLSPKGGLSIAGALEGLAQTDIGKSVIDKLTKPKPEGSA